MGEGLLGTCVMTFLGKMDGGIGVGSWTIGKGGLFPFSSSSQPSCGSLISSFILLSLVAKTIEFGFLGSPFS